MRLLDVIDWTSVKMCGVSLLGFISGSLIVQVLAGIAAISTIVYNYIRIKKEAKK